jgi:hypothetical protein
MTREYKPTSLRLRTVFVACALTITVAVAAFIDMLASERGALDTHAALPASEIAAHG